jgi:hypothetical protein
VLTGTEICEMRCVCPWVSSGSSLRLESAVGLFVNAMEERAEGDFSTDLPSFFPASKCSFHLPMQTFNNGSVISHSMQIAGRQLANTEKD